MRLKIWSNLWKFDQTYEKNVENINIFIEHYWNWSELAKKLNEITKIFLKKNNYQKYNTFYQTSWYLDQNGLHISDQRRKLLNKWQKKVSTYGQ